MHQDDGGFGNEGVYAMTTYSNRQSGNLGIKKKDSVKKCALINRLLRKLHRPRELTNA